MPFSFQILSPAGGSPPLKPHASAAPRAADARGFTLVELLLVIAIIGVLAAVIIPQFNVGMSGAKVRAAAESYMQASRYARTMALLHQVEVVVTVHTGGVIRVEAGALTGEARGPFLAPEDSLDASGPGVSGGTSSLLALPAAGSNPFAQPGRKAATNSASRLLSLPQPGAASAAASASQPAGAADVTADELAGEGDVAEEIRVERVYDDVHIRFLGYTDEKDQRTATASVPDETEDFNIRFRSNGTCRPYRVRITDDDTTTVDMSVDMLGSAVIEGEEQE